MKAFVIINEDLARFDYKIENELVQRLNIELSQGQMRLRVKVVAAKRQRPTTSRASTSTASTRPSAVLFKFATSEDR